METESHQFLNLHYQKQAKMLKYPEVTSAPELMAERAHLSPARLTSVAEKAHGF